MPILILIGLTILLEVILRLGFWNAYIKPQSYLGNAVYREKAIKNFGLDNIHWITIGDSKTDWGLIHSHLSAHQKKNNINHIRMSFESSNFMAMQATIDWSIANMPNLKGIMIGVSSDNFINFSAATKQYKVAWPFRKYFNYNQFNYFNTKNKLYSYMSRFAVPVYFSDLRFFFKNPLGRLKVIKKYLKSTHKNILNFNRSMTGDLCQYELENLKQCVETAQKISLKGKLNNTDNFIMNVCNTPHAKNLVDNNLENYKLDTETLSELINNWQRLFKSTLNQQIHLKLVMLPEHDFYNYILNPSNAQVVVDQVIQSITGYEYFDMLNLSQALKVHSEIKQCQFFLDPLHYNDRGKLIITQKIIDSFPLAIKQNMDPKSDIIQLMNFDQRNP